MPFMAATARCTPGTKPASRSWRAETLTPSTKSSPVTSRTAAASLTTWSSTWSPRRMI